MARRPTVETTRELEHAEISIALAKDFTANTLVYVTPDGTGSRFSDALRETLDNGTLLEHGTAAEKLAARDALRKAGDGSTIIMTCTEGEAGDVARHLVNEAHGR